MNYRVTQATVAKTTLFNLQSSMQRLQDLQNQLSSGKSITKPSDDPSGAVRSMQYRSDIVRTEQFAKNGDDALGWLGTADSTMTSSLTEIQKIRNLMLQAANATADPEARSALAIEVRTIKSGLIGLANTTYNNRPIFAGTADPASQTPAASTYEADGTYNGNTGAVLRTVGADATVQVNLDGPSVWGTPGASDLWHILDDIETHMKSTDPAEVAKLTNASGSTLDDLARLDAARVNIQNRLSEVGARYHRVETMQSRADDNLATIKQNLSVNENIDLAETTVALTLQKTAYQAALAATAKVIQPSLVDFLN